MRPDQKIGSSDLLGDQRGSGSGLQHQSGSALRRTTGRAECRSESEH